MQEKRRGHTRTEQEKIRGAHWDRAGKEKGGGGPLGQIGKGVGPVGTEPGRCWEGAHWDRARKVTHTHGRN